MGPFFTHCDTELRNFPTREDAQAHAVGLINQARQEQVDGWDEETTEGIVVLQVVDRAQKVDADADYRCVDYYLADVQQSEKSA